MYFADIHCHILCGVDDGAENEAEMYDMLDCAYNAGVRMLCATPHYDPDLFPHTKEEENLAFEALLRYAEAKYPDLRLFHGNEVFVYSDIPSAVRENKASFLSQRGHVLIEFSPERPFKKIADTVDRISNLGCIPVLAHIERYHDLDAKNIQSLKDRGAIITVNAESITGISGKRTLRTVHKYLKRGLIDIVTSDAHRAGTYMSLSVAFQKISEELGGHAAQRLFYGRASELLDATPPKKS